MMEQSLGVNARLLVQEGQHQTSSSMVSESRYGQMEVNTRVSGEMEWRVVEVFSSMLMGMSIMVTIIYFHNNFRLLAKRQSLWLWNIQT